MSILDFFRGRIEQRRRARHKVVTTAWLRLKDDTIPFVCVLWDVSEGGARLTVASKATIPDEFTLTLSRDAPSGTSCRVVWRLREQIGIQFIHNTSPISHLIKNKPGVGVRSNARSVNGSGLDAEPISPDSDHFAQR
jgi:hypothetical protein